MRRRIVSRLCVCAAVVLAGADAALANSPPVVSNVTATQRPDGTKKVDIRYNLADADGDACTVWVQASNDGGATWAVPITALTGAGSGVTPGTNKLIVWDCRTDLAGQTATLKVRVCADDGRDGPPMVLVPAGQFKYQNSEWVSLDTFLIDKYEVTNDSYCQFLNSADPAGAHWYSGMAINRVGTAGSYSYTVATNQGNHPVRYVSYDDAVAYAEWRSTQRGLKYRLPTEQQWEKAAAWDNDQQRFYTYGFHQDTISCSWCNYNAYPAPMCVGSTSPVGWYDGTGGRNDAKSFYGCYDMSGNLWEWTSSWYAVNQTLVFRGGGWSDLVTYCQCAYRNAKAAPSEHNANIGFRLVTDGLPDMVPIPAGTFEMGNALSATGDGYSDELPLHAVTLDAFYIDRYEVTKSRWDTVRAWATSNGYTDLVAGSGKAADHPVQTVSWYDCVKWTNARSQKDGRTPCYYTNAGLTTVYKTGELDPYVKWDASGYRLPTEAEWEKAARGGISGHRFPWSDSDYIQHARANYCSSASYSYDNSSTRGCHPMFNTGVYPYTSPVGYFAANGYGLYDMAGNVWEWCNDWYGAYSAGSQTNPRGPTSGTWRVLRGGGWYHYADRCRVANRDIDRPVLRGEYYGFRCAAGPAVGGGDACGDSGSFAIANGSTAGSIPPIGSLSLTADSVIKLSDSTWQLTGNVRINGLLRCTGTVLANQSTLKVSGAGEIWMDGVPLLGSVRLYNGSWQFDGNEAATTSINTFLSGLDLASMTVHCTRIGLVNSAVHIEGYIELPAEIGGSRIDITNPYFIELSPSAGLVYDLMINTNADIKINGFQLEATNSQIHLSNVGGTGVCEIYGTYRLPLLGSIVVNLDRSQGRYFWVKMGPNGAEWDLNGTLYVGRIDIVPPSIYAKELFIDVNAGQRNLFGQATVGFPAGNTHVEVFGTLGILEGRFDSASLDATFDPAVPVLVFFGVPVVSLDSAGLAVSNMSPASKGLGKSVLIEGLLGLVGGPEFRGYSLVALDLSAKVDVAGSIHGAGDIRIGNDGDGQSIITGTATVDVYLGKGVNITCELRKDYKGAEFILLNGGAAIDANRNFTAGINGSIVIPNSVPVIGAIAGGLRFGAEAYAQASPDSNNDNDYLAVGFYVPAEDLKWAIEISLATGKIDWFGDWDRIKEFTPISGLAGKEFGPLVPAAPEPFEVPPGVERLIFRATWETGVTELHLTTPSGETITPQNVGGFASVHYYSNTDPKESFYLITSPMAGMWQLALSESEGIGQYTLVQLQQSAAPTIVVTSPAIDTPGGQVSINWTAVDTDDDAKISLFYDTNRDGVDGTLIVAGLSEDSVSSYMWSTDGLAAGDYYVYALISDGKNVPAVSYSSGRVRVMDANGPPPPQDAAVAFAAEAVNVLEMGWNASGCPTASTFRVLWTADPAGEGYQQEATSSNPADAVLDGLAAGTQYRMAVKGVTDAGAVGTACEPVLVTFKGSGNNPPAFRGTIPGNATVGTPYQAQVFAYDVDGDAISYGPSTPLAGMSLSASGTLTWTPAINQLGNQSFLVTIQDSDGATNQRQFHILVWPSGTTDRPPEVVSEAIPDVSPGGSYSYPIIAIDPDIGDSLTYALISGPAGSAVSLGGVVTWPAATTSGWYEFLVRVTDSTGRFSQQRFSVLVDADAPRLNAAEWVDASNLSTSSIRVSAKPAADASGPVQFLFEVDGATGNWQDSPTIDLPALQPNTKHTFRVKARDRAIVRHESGWSDAKSFWTLAVAPPAPAVVSSAIGYVRLQLLAGVNTPQTELALFNLSTRQWVDTTGAPSAAPVWADTATWGTVQVGALAVDTSYLFQSKARNADGVETESGAVAETRTLAPDSVAVMTADREWIYGGPGGRAASLITLQARYEADPFTNSSYSYLWSAHQNVSTGLSLVLVSGGGTVDDWATYEGPGEVTASLLYGVTCTVRGNDAGNSVSGWVSVEVRPFSQADADKDGDVDLTDFTRFQVCFNGPNRPPAGTTCVSMDFDSDADVDLVDFTMFQTCFNGPNRPPACQ